MSEEGTAENPYCQVDKDPTIITIGTDYKMSKEYQTVSFFVSVSIPCDLAKVDEAADYGREMCEYLKKKYFSDMESELDVLCSNSRR